MMKRVLVTGGAGYVGTVLVKNLLDKGYAVRVLDQLVFGKEPLKEFISHPNFDLEVGLVEDRYMVKKCLNEVDFIIHLSGLSNDPSCEINPDLTRKANVEATKILLDLAKENGVRRFIYASSCSVYGFTEGAVVHERSQINPLTAYAKSKVDCEKIILPEAKDNFVVVCLRKATIYGPSPRMRFDLVINTMTGTAVSEKRITINGGEQWRPFLHVEDAADAYIFMLEAEAKKINGQIFNVGSNEQNVKISDLAYTISGLISTAKVEQSPSPDSRSYRVNFDKINTLGWKATRTINGGILGVVEMFNDGRVKDFRDLNYFNIKRMITYLNV
ncbi:SDR family oxidoreductase [Candidatus Woesearchaeota archaeon]|nr:SDR family oxidoreductase [Candidatus Woesearchaeota archaeon]